MEEGGHRPKTLPKTPAQHPKTESSWSRLRETTEALKVYVDEQEKQKWEQKAIERGLLRAGRPNLSDFIKTVVNLHVNGETSGDLIPVGEAEQLRAQIVDREREMERLQEENSELRRREIGVADRRIIERLSSDKPKSFDTLVQELLDTEAEAAYETLQRLIQKGIVEYVHPHNLYRLKPRAGRK